MGNDKKPRICEVLGVEVDEIFSVPDLGGEKLRINEYGHLCGAYWGEVGGKRTFVLCEAINHPERIKRECRWTTEDREQALAILTLFPSATYIQKRTAAPSIGVFGDGDCIIDIYTIGRKSFSIR